MRKECIITGSYRKVGNGRIRAFHRPEKHYQFKGERGVEEGEARDTAGFLILEKGPRCPERGPRRENPNKTMRIISYAGGAPQTEETPEKRVTGSTGRPNIQEKSPLSQVTKGGSKKSDGRKLLEISDTQKEAGGTGGERTKNWSPKKLHQVMLGV